MERPRDIEKLENRDTYAVGERVSIRSTICAVKKEASGKVIYYVKIPGYNDEFIMFPVDIVGRI